MRKLVYAVLLAIVLVKVSLGYEAWFSHLEHHPTYTAVWFFINTTAPANISLGASQPIVCVGLYNSSGYKLADGCSATNVNVTPGLYFFVTEPLWKYEKLYLFFQASPNFTDTWLNATFSYRIPMEVCDPYGVQRNSSEVVDQITVPLAGLKFNTSDCSDIAVYNANNSNVSRHVAVWDCSNGNYVTISFYLSGTVPPNRCARMYMYFGSYNGTRSFFYSGNKINYLRIHHNRTYIWNNYYFNRSHFSLTSTGVKLSVPGTQKIEEDFEGWTYHGYFEDSCCPLDYCSGRDKYIPPPCTSPCYTGCDCIKDIPTVSGRLPHGWKAVMFLRPDGSKCGCIYNATVKVANGKLLLEGFGVAGGGGAPGFGVGLTGGKIPTIQRFTMTLKGSRFVRFWAYCDEPNTQREVGTTIILYDSAGNTIGYIIIRYGRFYSLSCGTGYRNQIIGSVRTPGAARPTEVFWWCDIDLVHYTYDLNITVDKATGKVCFKARRSDGAEAGPKCTTFNPVKNSEYLQYFYRIYGGFQLNSRESVSRGMTFTIDAITSYMVASDVMYSDNITLPLPYKVLYIEYSSDEPGKSDISVELLDKYNTTIATGVTSPIQVNTWIKDPTSRLRLFFQSDGTYNPEIRTITIYYLTNFSVKVYPPQKFNQTLMAKPTKLAPYEARWHPLPFKPKETLLKAWSVMAGPARLIAFNASGVLYNETAPFSPLINYTWNSSYWEPPYTWCNGNYSIYFIQPAAPFRKSNTIQIMIDNQIPYLRYTNETWANDSCDKIVNRSYRIWYTREGFVKLGVEEFHIVNPIHDGLKLKYAEFNLTLPWVVRVDYYPDSYQRTLIPGFIGVTYPWSRPYNNVPFTVRIIDGTPVLRVENIIVDKALHSNVLQVTYALAINSTEKFLSHYDIYDDYPDNTTISIFSYYGGNVSMYAWCNETKELFLVESWILPNNTYFNFTWYGNYSKGWLPNCNYTIWLEDDAGRKSNNISILINDSVYVYHYSYLTKVYDASMRYLYNFTDVRHIPLDPSEYRIYHDQIDPKTGKIRPFRYLSFTVPYYYPDAQLTSIAYCPGGKNCYEPSWYWDPITYDLTLYDIDVMPGHDNIIKLAWVPLKPFIPTYYAAKVVEVKPRVEYKEKIEVYLNNSNPIPLPIDLRVEISHAGESLFVWERHLDLQPGINKVILPVPVLEPGIYNLDILINQKLYVSLANFTWPKLYRFKLDVREIPVGVIKAKVLSKEISLSEAYHLLPDDWSPIRKIFVLIYWWLIS